MKFDKHVAPPTLNSSRVETLQSMQVNESFLVTVADANKWRNAMSKVSHAGEYKFVSRAADGNSIRIWRIA